VTDIERREIRAAAFEEAADIIANVGHSCYGEVLLRAKAKQVRG
jgi:hypothetical protein